MVRRTHTHTHTERSRERHREREREREKILFSCDNNRHKVNIGKSLR